MYKSGTIQDFEIEVNGNLYETKTDYKITYTTFDDYEDGYFKSSEILDLDIILNNFSAQIYNSENDDFEDVDLSEDTENSLKDYISEYIINNYM